MRSPLLLLFAIAVSHAAALPPASQLPGAPGSAAGQPEYLPPEINQALLGAKSSVLYSLEPMARAKAGDETLQSWKVLGKTTLDERQTARAARAFLAAVIPPPAKPHWPGSPVSISFAMCFDPRHALSVESRGHRYDFLLCYECGYLYVYRDGKGIMELLARGSPRVLNAMLTASKIPLAWHESEASIQARLAEEKFKKKLWLEGMPPSIRMAWRWHKFFNYDNTTNTHFDLKLLDAPLQRGIPDRSLRIRALFGWLGSPRSPNAGPGSPVYEDVPGKMLLEYSMTDLITALQQAPPLTDPELRGATSFFLQRPDDAKKLPPVLKRAFLDRALKTGNKDARQAAREIFGHARMVP
ncbi:MAG TPA: hypothetical protein VG733_18990 [Chthoniobacteraceae bacterium]|nr:hypothetical protein [Chthoniobacteraceae bacterium]